METSTERADMEDEADERLVKAILHGIVAGALRITARQEPDAARGLMKAAAFHTERAATLLGEFLASAAREGGSGRAGRTASQPEG